MKKMIVSALAAGLFAGSAVVANAGLAEIDTYDVGTYLGTNGFPVPMTVTAAGISSSSKADVVNLSVPGSPAFNQISAVGWQSAGSNGYMTFEVYAEAGKQFDPEDFVAGGYRASGTGPDTAFLTADYVTAGGATGSIAISSFGVNSSYQNFIFDLDAAGLDGLQLTSLVIKLGGTGASSDGGTLRWGNYYDGSYTNMQVTGSVSDVPEPASLALLGLGGLAMLRRR